SKTFGQGSGSESKPNESKPNESKPNESEAESSITAPGGVTSESTDTLSLLTTTTPSDSDDSAIDSSDSIISDAETSGMAASSGSPTSLWGIFIAGLIGGFAAFLMPCIYPMVPLTTSFFT